MSNEFQYENPLITRYASSEMSSLWSSHRRISLWRQLWIWLAESERELGLPIREEQITQMRATQGDIDFRAAAAYEKELRHDVMAHVHAFGDKCPDAKPIIHLGATSCYVTDNGDLMMIRDALELTLQRLLRCIATLAEFAATHRALPCLAYTHFQPAQPTTVGKRACLWIYDLVLDAEELIHRLHSLKARSAKGTTGTQASFLQLFEGDHAKVRQLEAMIAHKMGFESSYAVTGQTYSRKVDSQILDVLAGLGQSLHKIATDLRLLAHRKEIEEPFESKQIGSSAMAYKRNPMRSERICSLARYAMSLPMNTAMTAATQWFERTLDDSANRRLVIPQSFLAIDACLVLLQNVSSGLVVYPKTIARNLNEELPFMATESIMMAGVAAGGDRQELHELIRQHSQAAALQVKQEGASNDLMQRLAADPAFANASLDAALDPLAFVGRSPEQVDEFIAEIVQPLLKNHLADTQLDSQVFV
jgi:adenylosuccinate lyase